VHASDAHQSALEAAARKILQAYHQKADSASVKKLMSVHVVEKATMPKAAARR